MQHAHLEILLRGMAENRRGQARGEGDVQEAVCLAVHLPPHWFPCSASPSGCQLAVWVRPLSSDVALLYHLLDTRSFRFLRASLLPLFHPSAILDAGANIGLASLVFAMRFPDALIVALEPARDNFELLQRNVKHLPQILPVNAALWSEDTQIAVTAGRREGFWAYETHVCGEMQQQQGGGKMLGQELEQQQQQQSSSNMNSLSPPSSAAVNHSPSPPPPCMPAVAVPSLLQRLQLPRFDYAKIDIEGAEGEVFSPDALARGGGSSGGWEGEAEKVREEGQQGGMRMCWCCPWSSMRTWRRE
ncbi:hypothetical protein CLOP_g23817 [Closterium sp. NIES-67]|nr:hypothetical protein CLOP_g23817 [Closterium sp. NIES-67]